MATIPSIAMIPSGYKASKVYSVLPTDGTGDFTFSRAGAATRVNKDGLIEQVLSNVPRLNYPMIDGVVSGCPSLLLEPQRTNLLTYTEQFDNIAWTTTNVTVTSNSTISPDGNTTADTLSKSTAGVDGTVVRVVSATASGYVGSIFVKKDTNTSRFPEFFLRSSDLLGDNEIYVQLNTSTGATAIRLQTGTASVSTPVLINGYWRISLYTLASLNTCRFGIRPAAGTTLGVFNENATGSIICYGAQLEAGSYSTSYIPTAGSSVTRVAETCSQTPPSGIIGQTEGVFYVEFSRFGFDSSIDVAAIRFTNSSSVEQIRLHFDQPLKTIRWRDALNGFANIGNAFTVVENVNVKVALKLDGSTLKFFSNGLQIGSNYIAPNTFNMSKIELNNSAFKIEDFRVYNTALTDQELQQLTSL